MWNVPILSPALTTSRWLARVSQSLPVDVGIGSRVDAETGPDLGPATPMRSPLSVGEGRTRHHVRLCRPDDLPVLTSEQTGDDPHDGQVRVRAWSRLTTWLTSIEHCCAETLLGRRFTSLIQHVPPDRTVIW